MLKRSSIFALFSILLILGGCKKHYAEKHFTGTFEFTSISHSSSLNSGSDTSYVFEAEVTYIRAEKKNYVLWFPYEPGRSVAVTVDKTGKVIAPTGMNGNVDGGYVCGDEDKIAFMYSSSGVSGGFSYKVSAERK